MTRQLLASVLALSVAGTGFAQLIHLRIDGTVTSKFEGESWWKGVGSGVDQPARLDLYYDPALPGSSMEVWDDVRTFQSNSTANNFWRLEYGALDVSAPFQTLEVSERGLSLYSFREFDFTTLDLRLNFNAPTSANFALPLPPLPRLEPVDPDIPWIRHPSSFVFDTAGGANFDEGSIFVGVEHLSAEIVPRFQPVPEPSTYALGATLLLGGLVLWRHRRPFEQPA